MSVIDRYQGVMSEVYKHYAESLQYFDKQQIVGIFLQGSQNYHLETPLSDVDTKLVVLPTFQDIVFNKDAISTTHVRDNNEHIDFKDLRLMFNTFRKQNINFIEILFTEFFILNPDYSEEWQQLIDNREMIAHYNIYYAIKAMKGTALEKYHALKHPYPSQIEVIRKFGYSPKQLHHLLRVKEFITRFLDGESYADCLISQRSEWLKQVKLGLYTESQADIIAENAIKSIDTLTQCVTKESTYNVSDVRVDELLNTVQLHIMQKGLLKNEKRSS